MEAGCRGRTIGVWGSAATVESWRLWKVGARKEDGRLGFAGLLRVIG